MELVYHISRARYFTGKPCKRGHIAERYYCSCKCVECRKEDKRKWRSRNPAKDVAKCRRWQIANPDKVAVNSHKRRAGKLGKGYTHKDITIIFKTQNGKCAYCRIALTINNKHIDHIVPLVLGGSNESRNIQLLCRFCNCSKGSKDPLDYARSIGMLL